MYEVWARSGDTFIDSPVRGDHFARITLHVAHTSSGPRGAVGYITIARLRREFAGIRSRVEQTKVRNALWDTLKEEAREIDYTEEVFGANRPPASKGNLEKALEWATQA